MGCCNKKKKTHGESEYLPLDGGHGWVVVFGGALTHFLLVGMARCLGIIYLALRTKFNTSATETAWATALFNTTRTLIAPVCGRLIICFGCRAVTIAGSLVLFTGLIVSAFATNIYYIYFSFGILTGSGGAMVFTSVYVIVGQYFDEKKGKAMGFATLGSGLGNVLLAPLIAFFMHYYGFFGSMLLLGALQLNHIISALLFIPLSKMSVLKPDFREEISTNVDGKENESKINRDCARQEDGAGDNIHDNISTPFLNSAEHTKNFSVTASNHECDPDSSEAKSQFNQCSENSEIKSPNDLVLPTYSPTNTPDPLSDEELKTANKKTAPKQSKLYRNFTFLVYGLLIMCLQAVIQSFLIFLPSYAKEKGATDTHAALVLSLMGGSDMAGRFLSGFIYDIKRLRRSRRYIFCVNAMLFGAATTMMTLMPSFVAVVIMTALTGIVEGSAHGQRMTIVSEFVPSQQMATAVGMSIFFQGVGNIWGPPVAGALQDAHGTCAYGYLFAGSMLMLFTLFFMLQILISRKRNRKNKDSPS